MLSKEYLIEKLGLKPHPKEGGFFKETYRSNENIKDSALPKRYKSDKSFGTTIFYLLTPETFSEFHKLKTDEIFHFYLGDPVTMVQLFPDGSNKTFILGQDIENGQNCQLVVPKGVWQGSFLNEGGEFALLGATVSPGFDYSDYESGNRIKLLENYPNQKDLIIKLTNN